MNEGATSDYRIRGEELPSEGVIRSIADLEGCDATALDPPLFSVIDPDALDQLFRRADRGRKRDAGQVTFTYNDHEVTVRGNGAIEVRPVHSSTD